ncbi:major capsid protein E [Aneurinibacillus soli]|uniref:Uncharacterized protein n=1 Tax=Aneurinibacillus soli TaxID=1500254 RepID=A0A0U4WHI6_9BACL|nr:major capsid protein [Aneurinibacillus soli]PYE64203.1 major capsid protein E [Aneurinibacillus soli]BAU28152.1 hypothetical protein CB4_02326 [Aneurinibacillus soli]
MGNSRGYKSTQEAHDDVLLTNIAVGYKNEQFIADMVFPKLPMVSKQSNRYKVFGMEDFRQWDDKIAANGAVNEIQYGESEDAYFCDGHGLSRPISKQEKSNSDDETQLEVNATRLTTSLVLLNKEIDAANRAMNPASYASGLSTTLGTTTLDTIFGKKWTDPTSDPVKQVDKAKEYIHINSGIRPNVLVVSEKGFTALKNHPMFMELIKYSQTGIVTKELLKAALGVNDIYVGAALRTTQPFGATPPGKPEALNYIWGNGAALIHVTDTPDPLSPTFGYTFEWDFAGEKVARRVRKWEDVRSEATYVETKYYYDQKVVCNIAGFLMADAI